MVAPAGVLAWCGRIVTSARARLCPVPARGWCPSSGVPRPSPPAGPELTCWQASGKPPAASGRSLGGRLVLADFLAGRVRGWAYHRGGLHSSPTRGGSRDRPPTGRGHRGYPACGGRVRADDRMGRDADLRLLEGYWPFWTGLLRVGSLTGSRSGLPPKSRRGRKPMPG